MAKTKTSDRILEQARLIFNAKTYASTTLTEIADAVGISQGNLTYHFPTKGDLMNHLSEQCLARVSAYEESAAHESIADAYIAHLVFMFEIGRSYRFLLRDTQQFADDGFDLSSAQLHADLKRLQTFLQRVRAEGGFRSDIEFDLEAFSRSLWVLSRFWLDFVKESDQRTIFTSGDLRRGIEHHIGMLSIALTAQMRRRFQRALSLAFSELDGNDASHRDRSSS